MAAPTAGQLLQNYGGFTTPTPVGIGTRANPNWGATFLGDLVTRPDFKAAILEEYMLQNAFQASGIIQRNAQFDLSGGGTVVTCPFFQPFDAYAEDIDSNADWGMSGDGYLTPQKINEASFRVPVTHKGFAAAVDDLSRMGTGEDPMAAIRSYIASNLNKFRNDYLLSLLTGVFGTGGALVDNVYGAPVAGAYAAANALNGAKVVGMQNLLGERGGQLTAIAMHSAVRNQLVAEGMLTFSSPANLGAGTNIEWGGGGIGVTNSAVEFMGGLRIIVDDRLVGATPASGATMDYPIYAYGPGVIQEGVQGAFTVETDRNVLSLQDVISCHWHTALGILGVDWKGTPAGTYPVKSEIETAGNWGLKWESASKIPLVKAYAQSAFGETTP